MTNIRWIKNNMAQAVFLATLAVVTLHLVASSLFSMEAPAPERLTWAVVAVAIGAAAGVAYPRLSRTWRGGLALAFGLPALATGIGIHFVHVATHGAERADVTGVPMALAGLLLAVLGTAVLVRLIHDWRRRLLLAPAGLVFLVLVFFPVVLAIGATNVPRADVCCEETPAVHGFEYEDVTFETSQGGTIAAWYIPSQNGAAIIAVHGSGSSRINTMDESLVLARNGYGVLMIDVEGFGASEGKSNGFGWIGARDVHAAVGYLRDERGIDPKRIGGLGLSMGGEVVFQAAGESDGLKAIVVEGISGRTRDDFDELPGIDGYFGGAFHFTVGLTMSLLTGESAPPPLKEMAAEIAPRPALLIAADIEDETTLGNLYQEIGGPSIQLWQIAEADHVGALDNHPEEYEERVIGFFNAALGSTAAVSQP